MEPTNLLTSNLPMAAVAIGVAGLFLLFILKRSRKSQADTSGSASNEGITIVSPMETADDMPDLAALALQQALKA